MSGNDKQPIFERYLFQIVSGLIVAGISSFFLVFFQVQKSAEATQAGLIQTQQKLADVDKMVMDTQKEVRSDLKEINDKLSQISILNTKLYDLEKRIDRLERIEKRR